MLKNAKHVYHVPNGEGCAKDRDKAKYHLANDIDHLLDLIETKVPQKNVFVVFASGGGTGSGISPYLLNILVEKFSTDEDGELSANPAKLFSAITILPSDSEPLQPAINSYSCCKEILDIENLGTVFFIKVCIHEPHSSGIFAKRIRKYYGRDIEYLDSIHVCGIWICCDVWNEGGVGCIENHK